MRRDVRMESGGVEGNNEDLKSGGSLSKRHMDISNGDALNFY
jgi:hypothetical protein